MNVGLIFTVVMFAEKCAFSGQELKIQNVTTPKTGNIVNNLSQFLGLLVRLS
jgi:hypothetical protein